MMVVYLAHPIAPLTIGGISFTTAENLARGKRWLKWACEAYAGDITPIAPYLTECELFDDADPAAREAGILRCEAVVAQCHGVWLVGGVRTSGMLREATVARKHHRPVFDLTSIGIEPPGPRQAFADEIVMWNP